jgi:predicted DNA-binding protein (MmcQ/YjbR family)
VERLRAICLALPEASEKVAWGEPTWRVRGRLFAQLDDHHHGADHLAVWLPAPLGDQEAMVFANPLRFFRPPYVGHRGWIGVRLDGRPDWKAVAALVEQAYRLVAPPRLREADEPAGDATKAKERPARRTAGSGRARQPAPRHPRPSDGHRTRADQDRPGQ